MPSPLPQTPNGWRFCVPGMASTSPTRPTLMIHGLADDNVVVAHTLLLSSALAAATRPHTVLLLPGVTHMAAQPADTWLARGHPRILV